MHRLPYTAIATRQYWMFKSAKYLLQVLPQGSGKRQQAVSGNVFDHSDIRAVELMIEEPTFAS